MSVALDFKRILREGLVSFWRNKLVSFSSLLIVSLSLLTLSLLLFSNGVLEFSLAQLEKRVDVNVYFYPDTPVKEIQQLQEKIRLIPEVLKVDYVSQEQALADFEKRHADDDLIKRSLEELGDNPLGASLNIRAKKSSQYQAIVKAIESDPLVTESRFVERINYHDNEKIIKRLNQFISVARGIVYVVMLFLSVISILVVLSTMRIAIYSAKKDVVVKRLVGAEHRYIRGPFTIMGMLYGFFAGIVTILALFPISHWLAKVTKTFFGGMDIYHYFLNNILQFSIIIIGSGIILASIASFLAVRKYLRI